MKKSIITALALVIGSVSMTQIPTAHAQTLKENFGQFKEFNLKNNVPFSLAAKNEGDSDYYFVHNGGDAIDMNQITPLISGKFDVKADQGQTEVQKVVGFGVYRHNGIVFTDLIFSPHSHGNLDNIRKQAQEFYAKEQARSAKMNPTLVTPNDSTPTYSDHYSWEFDDSYNSNTPMANYVSNVEYYRQGTTTLNGQTASVWDVKYFDQSQPLNGYQTRQVVTRSSVQAYSSEGLWSYGPFNTPSNASAQVSLTGLVPTLAWTFNSYDSVITDSSSSANNYGRWTFDITLGTSSAINSFVSQPGTRFTNTSGNMGFQHSHSLQYYKNLSAGDNGYTGILERFLTDL